MKWSWGFSTRRREKKRLAERRTRSSDRPGPLPAVRERALTLQLPPGNTDLVGKSRHQSTCDQQQSAFFAKLPQEIRYLIYREVLAPAHHPELHVASAHQRLLSRRCFNEDPDVPGRRHSCWGGRYKQDGTTAPNPNLGGYQPEDDSPYPIRLGLLRSCRQAYSESIDLLYSRNILSFRQTRTVVDLQHTILPQRLHSIRSVHFYFLLQLIWCDTHLAVAEPFWPLDIPFFWESAWKAIAEMKSLQSLRVELTDGRVDDEYPNMDGLVHLLKPMMTVGFPKYVVQFDWPIEADEIARLLGSELPFEVQVQEKPADHIDYW
ncbi:uncharacterized protein N7473_008900 [Penicillium subrubescens]|uniref:uncharacterized protein n=1 Tax=Penicillium subrubescens TaxID=1316194 RepID=UPI002545966D|nr:uncharacterized protein N7473_008900 [Penicillium subrubescens]KAJ5886226.1 hypothetical protein N7473_008900 [Penicillium subrubescens]